MKFPEKLRYKLNFFYIFKINNQKKTKLKAMKAFISVFSGSVDTTRCSTTRHFYNKYLSDSSDFLMNLSYLFSIYTSSNLNTVKKQGYSFFISLLISYLFLISFLPKEMLSAHIDVITKAEKKQQVGGISMSFFNI